MGRMRIQLEAFWILAGWLSLALTGAAQTSTPNPASPTNTSPSVRKTTSSKPAAKGRRQKAKLAKQVVNDPPPEPQPLPPPEPPKPEQMPAVPPTVSYSNGQLMIVAPNSSLGDILRAVKAKTGANFDIPPGAGERVVGKMGPGAPRDVLAALFNGTHFNYVMLGTANDPNAVSQIVLTPKSGGETSPAVQAGQPGMMQPGMQPGLQPGVVQPFPQAQVQGQAPVEEPQADSMEENNSDDTTAQDENANGDQGAPEQVQGAEAQQNPNQPNVKTPEQLLQELQRQQQIMQQQQQQQGQTGQPPVQQPQVIFTNPQQQQQPAQQPQ